MTQEEVNTIFAITIMLHEEAFFAKGDAKQRKHRINREIAQEWVARQLATSLEVYTIPVGSSWGVIVDKERYTAYWNENSQLSKEETR